MRTRRPSTLSPEGSVMVALGVRALVASGRPPPASTALTAGYPGSLQHLGIGDARCDALQIALSASGRSLHFTSKYDLPSLALPTRMLGAAYPRREASPVVPMVSMTLRT